MTPRRFTIQQLLQEAAKSVPGVWFDDGRINLAALARVFKKKGYAVSQPTLSRQWNGTHGKASDSTVEAFYRVLRIPRELTRGEPMNPTWEKALSKYNLSTLLIAERLESLPRADFENICREIDRAYEREEQLRSLQGSNVTPIDRDKR